MVAFGKLADICRCLLSTGGWDGEEAPSSRIPAEGVNFSHEECCLIEARGDSNAHFVATTPALWVRKTLDWTPRYLEKRALPLYAGAERSRRLWSDEAVRPRRGVYAASAGGSQRSAEGSEKTPSG
jgi:hypothetical protein